MTRETIRNIGIISHIDAGKTTVSERILFYSGETHKMGEVHDGQAVMDWMPQEQERGITITASATSCRWGDVRINLIDTPGHIDFTIEVERSMRVLDGAVAIFSAVEGVQPQSESVWRQADRYAVPRICFINKMDRVGSDYRQTLRQMEERLGARPVLLQLPLGEESGFSGVIDLLDEQALFFDVGDLGKTMQRKPLSPDMVDAVREERLKLSEALADFDESILADFVNGTKVSAERLRAALRRGTLACSIVPVLLGSALRNKGIQPLLDAVGYYLPSPEEVPSLVGRDPASERSETVACDPRAPLRALAFKVMSDEGRMLTYLRIYAGSLRFGATLLNSSRGVTERVGRLFRMHSHRREDLTEAFAGDIVAVLGFRETYTGDTLCDPHHPLVLEGLTIPEPVVSVAVEPQGADDREKFPAALTKLQWEDPTFRVHEDEETGQTILTGMGELHLEIVIDRLGREYGVRVTSGRPRVVYRETLRREVRRRELFRFEREGRAEVGEIQFRLKPLPRGSGMRFILPPATPQLTPALLALIEENLRQGCLTGCQTGYRLTDLQVEAEEIPFEQGVTTETGLKAAAQRGVQLAAREGEPYLLEPIMTLELTVPTDYLGKVLGTLQQKRGRVEGVRNSGDSEVLRATAPLSEMFGFMTELRSATRGRGSYTMEFLCFEEAPHEVQKQFGLG
ncbi:MAG: elongation factor G [Desulfuromonadales bacterium]|nr:elongation factor G [Desulfuromonadales bacterium]